MAQVQIGEGFMEVLITELATKAGGTMLGLVIFLAILWVLYKILKLIWPKGIERIRSRNGNTNNGLNDTAVRPNGSLVASRAFCAEHKDLKDDIQALTATVGTVREHQGMIVEGQKNIRAGVEGLKTDLKADIRVITQHLMGDH